MPFTKDDPNINREGRPKGAGISITTEIKKKLDEMPEGEDKKTYLHLLIQKILDKAVKEGDQIMIKSIWNYIDGMPRESLDLTSGGEKISNTIKLQADKSIKDFLNENSGDITKRKQGDEKSFLPVWQEEH